MSEILIKNDLGKQIEEHYQKVCQAKGQDRLIARPSGFLTMNAKQH